MKNFPVTVIHPMDAAGLKIGGIQTFVRNFIEFAPPDFEIKLVGLTAGPSLLVGEWRTVPCGGREINFFPVRRVAGFRSKEKVPLSLSFTRKVIAYRRKIFREIAGSVLNFHRAESALPFLSSRSPQLLYIHSDPGKLGSLASASRWRKFPAAYFLFERPVLRKAERVFCVSREGLNFYRDRLRGASGKVEFLPTTVNPRLFHRLAEAERSEIKNDFFARHRLPPQARLILFVGRFVEPKNFPLLLEVFARSFRKNGDLRFLLVGEGPLEEKVGSLLRARGLAGKVLLLGRQKPANISRIANISSLFISTSSFEGMPISLLEAMNCGTPAVVTGAGETKNVVRDGSSGRVVAGADPEKLADAVAEVISQPERYAPQNAIEAVKPYLVEKVMDKVYDLHRQLYISLNRRLPAG